MKSLSFWARRHIGSARVIIIVSQILILVLAVFIANRLSEQGIQFSPLWIYAGIVLFFVSSFIYSRLHRNSKQSYAWRKSFDFLLASLGFCLALFLANNLNKPFTSFNDASAAMVIKDPLYQNPDAEKLLTAFKAGDKTEFTSKEKRIIKKEFRYQVKKYVKAKLTGDKKAGDDAGLIILACVAALGLLALIAGLACNLSCGGSDAAAVILLIVGTAAVIWGLVAVIKSIKRKSKK
jgi:hypothetical protein